MRSSALAGVAYLVGGVFLTLWIIASVLGLELFGGRYCEDSSVCRSGSPGWAVAQAILTVAGVWTFIPLIDPRKDPSSRQTVIAIAILVAWFVVYFGLTP